jgi:hypothetical protein
MMGVATYIVMPSLNWIEAYKTICKLDISMTTKRITQTDRKMTEILRDSEKKYKFTSLFVIILGICLLFSDLYDIFILYFVENLVGVEHLQTCKHKKKPNAANIYIYESFLLENILLAAGHHLMKSLSWCT